MSDFFSTKEVKARKVHRCSDCWTPRIMPGDTYSRVACVYEGDFHAWKRCARCTAVWDAVMRSPAYEPEEGPELREYLGEHIRRTRRNRAELHPEFYCSTCKGARTVVEGHRYLPCPECEPGGACIRCHGVREIRRPGRGQWIACNHCRKEEFKAEMDRLNGGAK